MTHSPNIQQALNALEDERDHLADQLRWVGDQIEAIASHDGHSEPASEPEPVPEDPPAFYGSGDTRQRIINYLTEHPGSTAGEIAPALGAKRNSISTKLTQMARAGDIRKTDRGYIA